MPDFTLVSAQPKDSFSTDHGHFQSYTVQLDSGDEIVQAVMNQKSTTPPPAPGPITGSLEVTKFGLKFKKEFAPKPVPNGQARSDPDTQAKIVRQHSQTVAVQILAQIGKEFNRDTFRALCDWLDDDVAHAVARGK